MKKLITFMLKFSFVMLYYIYNKNVHQQKAFFERRRLFVLFKIILLKMSQYNLKML